jgi:hypothetical protein
MASQRWVLLYLQYELDKSSATHRLLKAHKDFFCKFYDYDFGCILMDLQALYFLQKCTVKYMLA